MKLHAPKIPYDLTETTFDTIFNDNELTDCAIYAATQAGQQLTDMRIYYSVLKQCDFSHTNVHHIDLTDVRFENCDFSNATFSLASIHRAQFINCKFVGTKFTKSSFGHVLFDQCVLTMASFEGSKIDHMLLCHSTLQQFDLYDMTIKALQFDQCDLSGAIVEQTQLKNVDLSRSYFDTITIEPHHLKGCIVSPQQAIYFASLLGLVIAE